MFVRNCWYVVAWAHEVQGDMLLERTVLGESLLIYRSAGETPVVLDNRCPHRHAPLSMGRREGDLLRCMYHGLAFDSSGQCVEVPGQERIPPMLRARSYPAVQKDAWIWVWMGDPARADESLIPDTYSLNHPGWRYKPGGYLRYEVDYLLICDNLLDFSHLSYVHERTLGGTSGIAESRPIVERMDRGVRITRDVRNTVPAPFHRQLGEFNGPVDRRFHYEFYVPGILLMLSHVKPSDTPDDDMRGALRMHSCQALTPETESSTHYFFMAAHDYKLDDESVTESIYRSVCEAFEEDKKIITAQQRLIERSNPAPLQPIPADGALGQFRFIVKQMADKEQRR